MKITEKKRYQHKITIGKKPDGTLLRKTFYSYKSKKDAKRKAEEWKIEQKACSLAGVTLPGEDMPFSSWAAYWLEVYKKPNVSNKTYCDTYLKNTQRYIIPYFKETPLQSIRPVDIKTFFAFMSTYSQSLLNKLRIILNGLFESAADNEYCIKNPCRNIHPKGKKAKEKKTYTKKENDVLIQYARNHHYGLMIWILLECGLRPGELLGLKKKDFDIKNKTLHVCRAVSSDENGKPMLGPPKTEQSDRVLPISAELAKAIKNTLQNDLLFVTKRGNLFTEQSFVRNRYNVFFKDLNADRKVPIKKLSPYCMRHTCATLLYNKTKDIYALSKFLGHASIEITASTYVHTDVEQLREHLNVI